MSKGSSLRGRARKLGSFLRYAGRRYQDDDASRMAAALAYTSLLSLVPLLAIALAMLAAFPVFDDVRDQVVGWAFRNFVPQVGEVIQTQVNRFIANAGRLTAAGIVGLAFTAIMLLVTIEGVFNSVFRVTRERTILAKLLVYWTVVTLGPLLIGMALSLQGYLTALNKLQIARSAAPYLAAPLPTLLTIAAFAVLFATIPNRRVRVADALAGAVAAGLLFAALRWGFGLYITSSKAYANLYGAVAAVPIFLLWMFLSWAVVLAGAEITAALPEWRAGFHRAGRRTEGARRLTLALAVLARLLASTRAGTGPITRRQLLEETALPEAELAPVLAQLCATDFAAQTDDKRYLPARDLSAATLMDLVEALGLELALDEAIARDAPWRAKVEALLTRAEPETLRVPLAEVVG